MSIYDRYVLPRLIHFAMRLPDPMKRRQRLIPEARGRVLEFGIGSGLNLPFYGPEVSLVEGVDPSAELALLAEPVARDLSFPVRFHAASAEALPFEAAEFDTVVSTWSLCTIPDYEAALAEARRVLKPDGCLLFVEHGKAPDDGVARWQDRLDRPWGKIAGGCHLNRPIDSAIAAAGFRFTALETKYVKAPKIAAFHYIGRATPG